MQISIIICCVFADKRVGNNKKNFMVTEKILTIKITLVKMAQHAGQCML